ncbi:hypothetical protein HZ326_1099 [Fusarium oxysporum f. sp. albedinis]|jgi:hypothetical protein|nr:hypothetical protein HZ326_1099 [Fusarium oxysporum f. sp. albedinis]
MDQHGCLRSPMSSVLVTMTGDDWLYYAEVLRYLSTTRATGFEDRWPKQKQCCLAMASLQLWSYIARGLIRQQDGKMVSSNRSVLWTLVHVVTPTRHVQAWNYSGKTCRDVQLRDAKAPSAGFSGHGAGLTAISVSNGSRHRINIGPAAL